GSAGPASGVGRRASFGHGRARRGRPSLLAQRASARRWRGTAPPARRRAAPGTRTDSSADEQRAFASVGPHPQNVAVPAVLVLALLVLASPVRAVTQQEVEESLTCQCGCGLTVHACHHLQCPSGEPMKKAVAQRLAPRQGPATLLP